MNTESHYKKSLASSTKNVALGNTVTPCVSFVTDTSKAPPKPVGLYLIKLYDDLGLTVRNLHSLYCIAIPLEVKIQGASSHVYI